MTLGANLEASHLVLPPEKSPSLEPGRTTLPKTGNSLSEGSMSYQKSFPAFKPKLAYLWSQRKFIPFPMTVLQIRLVTQESLSQCIYVLRACQLILTTIL